MSVISSITATDISTTGTTINYTLGSSLTSDIYLYKFISRIDVPTPLTAIGDTVVLVQTVVSGTPTGNYSITDTNLTSNTAYSYAFYNGNTSGTAIPYSPFVHLKTYVDVTSITNTSVTETSAVINYNLSNTLSSQTACYLYRYSSSTSIPTAPTILNTSTATFIASTNVSQGTNVSPTTLSSSSTDSTLSSNTSYVYAFYNGQNDASSTILTDTILVVKTSSTITFATASSITATNVSNTLATINYNLSNAISASTDTYLFRFAATGSAPITDPTSGVQVGSAITTTANGGTSTTPINSTGLTANTQYTFAFYNGTSSSATIIRDNTSSRVVKSVSLYTTNVLNTSLTASSLSPISATINYTLSNTPSNTANTVYLYRFSGNNSAPSTLSGGTFRTSVALTANNSEISSSFSETGLTINTEYTYAFYSGNVSGTSVILTSDGTTSTSLSIDTYVNTVAFTDTTNILNTTATVNYILTNANSTTTPSYLYRFVGATAPSTLSGGTYVDSANSIGSADSINDTGLTTATKYTYAFYNGQTSGTSIILTNPTGTPQSTTFNTTNLLNTALTNPTLTNTQARINYTLTNTGVTTSTTGVTISATGYLYRFTGTSAPTSNPITSGTLSLTVVDPSNQTVNTFFNATGLTPATYYTFAFYNGNTSSSIILTNASSINQSITVQTTDMALNTLTSSNVTLNSSRINYNISNSNSTTNATIRLFRFTTTPPNASITNGTLRNTVTVNGGSTIDASLNETGLTSTFYYYAFYDVSNTILPIVATGTNFLTVKNYVDVSELTATNITPTSALISYTLNNSLSISATSYLYRFNSATAPASNPTTNGTNMTSILLNSGDISSSTITDTNLASNKVYTYAFYTTNTSSGVILRNNNGVATSVRLITSEYDITMFASAININSATINYSIENPLTTPETAYLYRFPGSTTDVPLSNPTSGTQLTSVDINANSSVNGRTFSSTGLTQNTAYSYAFYTTADSDGTILTDFSGNAVRVQVFTDMYVQTLSITYIASSYLTLSYRLGNKNSITSSLSYLYRFTGATAPSILDTSIGTLITSNSTTVNSIIQSTGLTPNTQYTYAFYDGSRNGINTIMYAGTGTGTSGTGPTFPLTSKTITGYTSNQVVTDFSSTAIFNTSTILSYSITNNNASTPATVYLYRFTTTPPTLLSGGTNIIIPTNVIAANGTLTNPLFANTGLSASTTYYYAFYDGSNNSSSSILPITGGENSITVQTTGVSQSSITATAINDTGATINYTIANAANSSTATLYLYRYLGKTLATTPLNKTTGTQVTNISPQIPITLTASGTTTNSVSVSDLSANKIYSFQFYNSNIDGSSSILSTLTTGGTNQFVYLKTGVSDISLSYSNISNTSATLTYTLHNTNNTSITSYLYRFNIPTVPTTLNSNGTLITSVDISAGSNASPYVYAGTYPTTGLTSDTKYTYAFYNGQVNNTSTILTDLSGNDISNSFTTSNLLNTVLSINSLTSTNAVISYTLTNNATSQTAYLYRFTGTTAPTTLNNTGTNIITGGVTVSGSNASGNSPNPGATLTPNTNYTYAFYNGNTLDSSTILTTDGTTPKQITIFTTTNVIITTLNPTGLTNSEVQINYRLLNYQNASKTSYLYRFVGPTAPATLNTSTGTFITSPTTSAISSGNPGITDSSFNNTGLSFNTTYTYGFYSGQTNGSSIILANTSGTALTTTVYTTNESIVSSLTSSTLSNTFNRINYIATNNQSTTKSLYLYRFTSTSAPDILSSSNNATSITNFTLISGDSSNNSFFDDSLTLNTNYTYAFYNGNSIGSSLVITNYDGSPQVLNIATTDVFNPSLTATNISTTSATINYTITNTPSSSGINVYLYRFDGLSAPTTLTTTGSYSSAIQLQFVNTPAGTTRTSFYTDNTISPNTNYIYAFYNGTISGTNTILQDTSETLNPQSVPINTFYGIITSLSVSETTNTSTYVNYTIINDLADPDSVYLYRFDTSFSAPSTLNTSLSGAVNLSTLSLPANDTLTSSYFDPTLSANSQYTYAIYNGTTDGVSLLLTDSNDIGQSVVATTESGTIYPPTSYDVSVTTYKNTAITIHLEATDPQNSALTYTYTSPTYGSLTGTGPDVLYTPTSTGADSFTYYATNEYELSSNPSTVSITINNSNPPCFKEGTKILCFNPQEGKEEYRPIETIRKGTLVKTIKHGYVKVDMIGKSTIYNSGDSERITNRLYLCTPQQYPQLFEELIITGYHAILVDRFKDAEEKSKTRELLKKNYMTDGKYRLPACMDERASPFDEEGEFTIWHVALENDDYFMNYGIYANGLLVESCSKRFLKELSKMTLVD